MNAKKIKNGYDDFYKHLFTDSDEWTNVSAMYHPRRWIASLAEIESGRCLAIGCGMMDLKVLQSHRKELVGIDITKVPLAEVRKFGQVILADGTQLPFCDSIFDTACLFDVLEHIPNKIAMITEAARVLRNKGKMFLSVPIRTKGMKKDERQPFDDPPALGFLLQTVKRGFHLLIIRGFYGRNPFNRIPYARMPYHTFSFLLLFFRYIPHSLAGSSFISIVAAKRSERKQ